MTRFARDAKFRHARVKRNLILLSPRLSRSGMTIDTADIPDLFPGKRRWVFEKHTTARNPAFLIEQIRKRQAKLLVPVSVLDPISLHVMGTGDHRDAALHAGTSRFGRIKQSRGGLGMRSRFMVQRPIRIDHLNPELIPPVLQSINLAVERQVDLVKNFPRTDSGEAACVIVR